MCSFFRVLQGNKSKILWGESQSKVFHDLKEFLLTLPVLDFPRVGETLFLYLAIFDVASTLVLFREENGVQRPIFYISKSLCDAEKMYSKTKRMVLALHELRKKLSHYFQGRKIVVFTLFPIHSVLLKFDYARRIGL